MKNLKTLSMSNLIKSKSVVLPKEVSNLSRCIYNANSFDMIKNFDDLNIVANSVHTSINCSIADKGVNMSYEDINYLKEIVLRDILNDFKTLTLQDVSLCFSMGVRGNLGEYYGLNVVTFYGWLKKYKEELIPQAICEVQKHIAPIQIEEEKVDYKKLDFEKVDNLCNAINLSKEHKQYNFNDYGNIHFSFLNKFGFFNYLSDDDKKNFKQDAIQLYVNEAKENNFNLIKQGKNFQMTNIDKLMQKIEYGEKDTELIIDILYRKLLLKKFIVDFHFLGNDLERFKNELNNKIIESYEK